MKKEMSKIYDPKSVESRIYADWQEKGLFKPEVHPKGEAYTIVMPPPNITGQLHMGHAFDGTLQDVLTRYKRMDGYSALWLPGTDHASIATEVKVVDKLREEENKTKLDIGREAYMERAWDWALTYKTRITEQLKKLGASCDWSRERFTMDEGCVKAVNTAFINLYNQGLIYKGNRIINWCPTCKTALSEAEVEYAEQEGHLWHIRYPLEDGDGWLTVATTRPETMLGDSGVAVHPEDERYLHLIGKNVILPLMDKKIPIVADDYVDKSFGTGVVKMTPAHDPNDYEVGLRHNLEQIRVLNDDATMNALAGKYSGMDRYTCRKAVLKDLEALGLLEKTENHLHNVGECYRCSTTVETMTSEQWFVKMKPLAEPALEAVKSRQTEFIPDRFSKIYYNWMENIRDWCISRQLWWGHRIPAYYCDDCGEIVVSEETPLLCPKCSCKSFKQDEDVLDTWFSSGLWPFSTLGWPEKTEDLSKFYPTTVLVTGYDIIFFWVARMIFMGIHEMGETPFKDVYIHGLVRDSQGRKMSKSLGNGIDPLELIDTYSADALRFTIITGNSAGNDIRWQDEKVESSRNFLNKIWNAARFVLMNLDEDITEKSEEASKHLENTDRWILSRMNQVVKEVNHNMSKYELGIAASKIYDFAWNEYCDWYIELVKPRLYGEEDQTKIAAQYTLQKVLDTILRLLHPFTPFITEEINSYLPGKSEEMIVSKWPHYSEDLVFEKEEREVTILMNAIRSIRNIRAEMDVPNSKKTQLFIISQNKASINLILNSLHYFQKLASVSSITEIMKEDIEENFVSAVVEDLELYLDLDELVDKEKEIARLENERQKLQKEIDRVNQKLSNKGFTDKAPQKVVDEEKEKQRKYLDTMEKVMERLHYYKK
ncbi:MAG: valine--tRNA ligase [Eubacteriaceae bacterium]